MNESPRYATLLYDVRKALDVSIAEYFYLDMIHKLSYNRWCSKSLEKCAEDMGVTKRGLIKLRDRLLAQGLLKKNADGHLKVTTKYIEVAVNKVHQQKNGPVNKVPRPVNKVHRVGELSSQITGGQNNNRITREYRANKKLVSEQEMPGASRRVTGPTTGPTPITESQGYRMFKAAGEALKVRHMGDSPAVSTSPLNSSADFQFVGSGRGIASG